MSLDQILRKNFALVLLPVVGVIALLNAHAVNQLVGIGLAPDEKILAQAPAGAGKVAAALPPERNPSAEPILARNPFDHETGPLRPPPPIEGGEEGEDGVASSDDIWSVPECDGVSVRAIAAGDDKFSLAALAGSDGKVMLRGLGDDVSGKKVLFVGWDRVWLDGGGSLCQAKLFPSKSTPSAPATPPPTETTAPPTTSRRGAAPVDPDIKKGIQKVSDTEYNIDRGTVDKILENQADLMRQARITPVQENGRVVGVRMQGIRPDSLLGTLGMQNGDQLRTINGFDMGSPEKALEAYARLRTADKLTVQVSRGGKVMNLDYNIR